MLGWLGQCQSPVETCGTRAEPIAPRNDRPSSSQTEHVLLWHRHTEKGSLNAYSCQGAIQTSTKRLAFSPLQGLFGGLSRLNGGATLGPPKTLSPTRGPADRQDLKARHKAELEKALQVSRAFAPCGLRW